MAAKRKVSLSPLSLIAVVAIVLVIVWHSPFAFKQNSACEIAIQATTLKTGSGSSKKFTNKRSDRYTVASTALASSASSQQLNKTNTGNRPAVAICTMAKDQHPYLREWVDHNLGLGIDKIYLYDHNSEPSMLPVVEDYVKAKAVKYISFVHHVYPLDFSEDDPTRYIGAQLYVHQDCLETYGHLYDWMGFVDVDEFLVLINNAAKLSIPQLLTQYSDYSGLAMNWRVIGSSGHKTKPKTSVLASYTHCLPTTDLYSRYVKMFVQPKYMTLMMTHGGNTIEGAPDAVFDDFSTVEYTSHARDTSKEFHGSRIVVYHYYTRSKQEAYEKVADAQKLIKQRKWWPTGGLTVDKKFVDNLDKKADANKERCLDGLRYAPENQNKVKLSQAGGKQL